MALYTTNFTATEAPISESGKWVNNGLDWTLVDTTGGSPGTAFGTQGNSGNFDDSYAHLTGTWSPNQEVGGTVHKGTTFGLMEVELHMRMTDSAHNATVYEVTWAHDGQYVDFVRWHGPIGTSIGDFTFLVPSATYTVPGGIQDGDQLVCRIIGNTISAYRNGTLIGSASDTAGAGGGAVLTSGNPGMGFYRSGGAAMTNYCFSSYYAMDLGSDPIPRVPRQVQALLAM